MASGAAEAIIIMEEGLKPIAAYSHGVAIGDLLFVSGHVGVDVQTGKVPDDPKEETRFLMEQIRGVVERAGLTMSDICKTTIFVTDFEHYGEINEVYREYFPHHYPARSTVQVAGLLLGARLEIEVIAVRSQPPESRPLVSA